jgi:hypothetical protein
LVSLKEVKLYRSKLLSDLPDFSKASNLEVLDLGRCPELTCLHPSIFFVNKLQKLDLYSCGCLTEFTGNAPLRYLNLGWCENLEVLNLEFSEIENIKPWINNLTRLRHLNLKFCMKLQTLPELPSSVEIQLAELCKSLTTILFPSTAAEQFKENRKRVEFWNCGNLSEVSLEGIRLNAQINLMRSVHQHAQEHDYKDNYASYQTSYVYPGSSVPDWMLFKTTENHMIIDLSNTRLHPLLGIIFCFILAEGFEYCDQIELSITTINDSEKEDVRIYMTRPFFCMNMDHVCMIYDQPSSRYLTRLAKNLTKFKIKVTARSRDGAEVVVKGFGVSPVSTTGYNNFIQLMEWFDYINKWCWTVLILCISFQQLKIKNLI